MGYLRDWADFAARAEALVLAQPARTRVTLKYRPSDAQLVLKVTDDVVCLKFKTGQAQDLKRIDKLNTVLMRHLLAVPAQ